MASARPSKVVHCEPPKGSSVRGSADPSAAQHAGAADFDGHEPVAVAREVAVVVVEGDGDVGEVGVVGADRVAVGGRA